MLLNELFDFMPKSNRPASFGKSEGKYPFFNSSNIIDKFVDEPDYSGEFLIIGDGGTGNCKYYSGEFSATDHTYLLKPKKNTNCRLIKYFLEKDNYKILNDGFKGVGIKNVSKSYIQNIEFKKNKNYSDQFIIEVLDSINKLIKDNENQLILLDELIKSRFIEMFGDPENEQNNLVKIGNIGHLTSGGTPSRTKPQYFDGSIKWFSAGELNNLYLYDSIEHITEEALNNSSAKLFKKGTLMIGMYDTAAFKMGILTDDSSSNQACANLSPNKNYNVVWLYYVFNFLKEKYLNERQGVRQKNLSLSKIKDFEFPSAPIELQNEFASFVEQIDKSKFSIQQHIKLLQELLDKKMDEYFDN